MKLKSLKDHNNMILEQKQNEKTNVECPKCHKELEFSDNNMLLSFPPQRAVRCRDCYYDDYIFV